VVYVLQGEKKSKNIDKQVYLQFQFQYGFGACVIEKREEGVQYERKEQSGLNRASKAVARTAPETGTLTGRAAAGEEESGTGKGAVGELMAWEEGEREEVASVPWLASSEART
jgi:hypothetical protein